MIAFVAFIAVVVLANLAVVYIGPLPVGFGLYAPAGVYVAGFAFTLRDILHAQHGRGAVGAAIVVGAAVSAIFSAQLAIASATAFALSELADLIVYERLRRRGWTRAVVGSNLVGLVVDSALFLWLAFGSLAFLPGQILGKIYATIAFVVVGALAEALRCDARAYGERCRRLRGHEDFDGRGHIATVRSTGTSLSWVGKIGDWS